MSQQAADQSQDYGKNNTEQCGYSNTFAHAFFVLCTTPLAKADTESTGKTIDKAKDKIDNDTGGTDCCKGISTKRFADDHRVSKCIKKLKRFPRITGIANFNSDQNGFPTVRSISFDFGLDIRTSSLELLRVFYCTPNYRETDSKMRFWYCCL